MTRMHVLCVCLVNNKEKNINLSVIPIHTHTGLKITRILVAGKNEMFVTSKMMWYDC